MVEEIFTTRKIGNLLNATDNNQNWRPQKFYKNTYKTFGHFQFLNKRQISNFYTYNDCFNIII